MASEAKRRAFRRAPGKAGTKARAAAVEKGGAAPRELGARVLALLEEGPDELRCAAALVLGAAGRGDGRVPAALAKALGDPSPMVRRFVLEALETVGARGLAGRLLPLVDDGDEEVRGRALRLLGAQGAAAEGALASALARGAPAARRQAAGMLVRLGSERAWDALLEALGEPELGEHVLALLRAELDRTSPRGEGETTDRPGKAGKAAPGLRGRLRRRAAAAARKLAARRDRGSAEEQARTVAALAGTLRLLGYAADPEDLPRFVAEAARERPLALRVAALAAMRRIVADPAAKRTDAAILALLEHVADPEPKVARAAVDTLVGAHIPSPLVPAFARLTKSENPDARRLALQRLPALGKTPLATLIAHLGSSDAGVREAAARALQAAPEAAGPIARALAEAEDETAARRLALLLRAHEGRVPRAAVDELALAARRRADEPGRGPGGVLLEALGRLAPEAYAGLLFERAAKLRKAGRAADAFAALRPLAHAPVKLDDEQRFLVGLLGLKAGGRDLLRAARTVDPVLQQFAQLVASGYPVARRLAREKDVTPDDLFTLGFNFAESHDEDERELGRELLEAIVAKSPSAKLAVAAKNKLRLVAGV